MRTFTDSKTQKALTELGLSEKEARVYMAALQFQTFVLAQIARVSGIKRPTCYLVIEGLLEKGYIARVPDSKVARYICVEPKSLLEKEKERIKDFESIVEVLGKRRNSIKSEAPHIELFYGIEGVKNIYQMILVDRPKTLLSIANPDYLAAYLGADFVEAWVHKRVSSGIAQYALMSEMYDKNGLHKSSPKIQRQARLLPESFNHNSMYYIWDNKVAFISNKKEGVSFVVVSEEFADLQNKMFLEIWENAIRR